MTDIIKAVRTFTEAVGCTTDRFNVRQAALYTGLQIEEMAEKLEAVLGQCKIVAELNEWADKFKAEEYDEEIAKASREDMLDADIDLAWVTIGSALSQGADVDGAAGEVARANLDKLVTCKCVHIRRGGEIHAEADCPSCNGVGMIAIKDGNGKVKKPEGWTAPNVAPFTCNRLAESEGGEE